MLDNSYTYSDSESDYFEQVKLTKDMKALLSTKLNILKLLTVIILLYIIIFPIYNDVINELINYFYIQLYYFNVPTSDFLDAIFLVIFVILIVLILRGKLYYGGILTLISFILLIVFEKSYLFWPLKIILIILFHKLVKLIEKFQVVNENYSNYENSYFELVRVNYLFDNILRKYFLIAFELLISSYFLFLFFQLFSIDLGLRTAILVAMIIVPLTIISLFKSREIFRSLAPKPDEEVIDI